MLKFLIKCKLLKEKEEQGEVRRRKEERSSNGSVRWKSKSVNKPKRDQKVETN